MTKLIHIVVGSFLVSTAAFAAEGGLPFIALGQGDGGSEPIWFYIGGGFLLLLGIVLVATSLGPRFLRPSVDNLFLGMPFRRLMGKRTYKAYLRSLDLREAVFVSPRALSKGEAIQIDLGKLPDFPSRDMRTEAKIVHIRSLGGEPETYLVTARFHDLKELDTTPLQRYLQSLARSGRRAHA